MPDRVEIIVPATAITAEEVAGLLSDEVPEAYQGALIRGTEVVFFVSDQRRDAAVEETRRVLARLAAAGLDVDPASIRTQAAVPESEWRDTWKQFFHTTYLTRRIVVVPSWEQHAPAAEDVLIHLDPGQAFGTGAHASTRLVLRELDELSASGAGVERFLDVGCGSGILAIAAARLWPGSAGVAVDRDPLAVEATAENRDKNQVTGRIAVSGTPLAEVTGSFDLVMANIQADVLHAMAEDLADRVGAGGHLILSGLLTQQVEAVARHVADAGGLTIAAVRSAEDDPEWSSALLVRHA